VRVLVCDDHAHVRRVLQLQLERAGFEVRLASDGEEALRLVDAFAPQALVTDITMPGMGGRELCEALQAAGKLPALRVLVVTSRTERALRAWIAALPGVTLLEKPLSPRQVCDWVASCACTEVGE
jgi:CheY-like chemotaxis protein